MKNALIAFAVLATALPAAPAFAQAADTVEVERNTMIYDVDGSRIGRVNRIGEDGELLVIYRGAAVVIPADTLSQSDDHVVTSLSRRDLR